MVPIMARIMEQHDVISLEEPPEFNRSMCYLERELYAGGKQLIQVEPFVEALFYSNRYCDFWYNLRSDK